MKINSFTVLPDTLPKLKSLIDLAYNLYFSWTPEVTELFKKLDEEEWERANGNPVRMLCQVSHTKLLEASEDPSYLAELESVHERFKKYLNSTTWYDSKYGKSAKPLFAYFSAEYALHDCLAVYSGGLGVLSGDHIKSASDLGMPLVGVGLLYRQGYFEQYLNIDGWQQESYPENDWYSMPVKLVKDDNGLPLLGEINMAGETVRFHVWRVDVGRVCIYMLDTNVRENSERQRDITKMLYDPDRDIRLRQEILLGIGGLKTLTMMGIEPSVIHLNEGHSAFVLLEQLQQLRSARGLTLDQAKEVVFASNVFTTHTPVSAGNERFAANHLEMYFLSYTAQLGMSWFDFLALGKINPHDPAEEFCMTVLALKLCACANGVSKLHGEVSRKLWKNLYPQLPVSEVPIGAIVNGVHVKTWIAPRLTGLLKKYSKSATKEKEFDDINMWTMVDRLKDEDIWQLREDNRAEMVEFVRERVRRQFRRYGSSSGELRRIDEVFDPNCLTIGFARRFTSYKRGGLLFRNIERLKRLVLNPNFPVQIVLAGKAHPADQRGKDIIRSIHEISMDPELSRRIVFIENYNLAVAQYLVRGVDVWLNTPSRPMEASGTSGMKCAVNGGLNVSILDGWWDEAYTPEVGWPIGKGESYDNMDLQDKIESDQLYAVLEKEVVPAFYQRDKQGLPRDWIQTMRNSMRELGGQFSSYRMVQEYAERFYNPVMEISKKISADEFAQARHVAQWRQNIAEKWHGVRVVRTDPLNTDLIYKGMELEIKVWVDLNQVSPDDVHVECYHGPLDHDYQIIQGYSLNMSLEGVDDKLTVFSTKIVCTHGGRYGFTVRVVPYNENLFLKFVPSMMKWLE